MTMIDAIMERLLQPVTEALLDHAALPEGGRALELEGAKSSYGTSTASPNTMDARTGEVHPTLVEDIAIGARVADAMPSGMPAMAAVRA